MALNLRQARGRRVVCGLAMATTAAWCAGHTALVVAAKATTEVEESSSISSMVTSHATAVAVVAMVVSTLASMQEPQPAVAAVPVEKRPDLPRVTVVASVLSGISGMVNAVAIIQMGGTVAHHTGNASHTGRLAGVDGGRFLCLMVCYFIGAAVTGLWKSSGEAPFLGKRSPALFGSAIAVAAGGLIHHLSDNKLAALPVLAFSQGIHNGVTSKFSSMPLRTTHMTGTLTDTGAACGAWLRSKIYGDAPPPAGKVAMLMLTLFAFGFGGVLAKVCVDSIGSLACLPPAAVLAVMALGVLPLGEAPKA